MNNRGANSKEGFFEKEKIRNEEYSNQTLVNTVVQGLIQFQNYCNEMKFDEALQNIQKTTDHLVQLLHAVIQDYFMNEIQISKSPETSLNAILYLSKLNSAVLNGELEYQHRKGLREKFREFYSLKSLDEYKIHEIFLKILNPKSDISKLIISTLGKSIIELLIKVSSGKYTEDKQISICWNYLKFHLKIVPNYYHHDFSHHSLIKKQQTTNSLNLTNITVYEVLGTLQDIFTALTSNFPTEVTNQFRKYIGPNDYWLNI